MKRRAQKEEIMWSKYCTECRNHLKGDDEFCPKCGTRQPYEQPEQHLRTDGLYEPKTKRKPSREKNGISKIAILSVITIVFLVVSVISFYFIYDGIGNGSSDEIIDSDGDGVGDNIDAFPNDSTETKDFDGDGVGDNKDAFPEDNSENLDSDNDGIGDNADVFPTDPTETKDSDSDGVGDNSDAFPSNPSETKDSDSDGVGDNADVFPNDPTESTDSDNDGVGDNSDAFPTNPSETHDSDSDGVGDNIDAFPNDPTENKDSDGDGVGDVSDDYKHDPTEWADSDGDGVGDNADIYDKGNGALKISITSYEGDNSDNVWFKIDINQNPDEDTTFENTKSSEKISTTANTPISNPFSYKVDVDERIDVFNFTIYVYAHRYDDGGFWGSGYYYDTPVDYTPESDTKIYYQTISHFKGEPDLAQITYSYDGRSDYNNNERDCILKYTMSIVPA